MNQRQLANVLLKVSGIIGVIHSIPMFIFGVISALTMPEIKNMSWTTWMIPVSVVVSIVLSAALILYSEKLATTFFKSE